MATISPIFNGEDALDGVNKINAGFAKLNELDETEGKTYQGNGTGIDSLSREDFGKQIQVYVNSPSLPNSSNLIYWETFNRGDISTGLGTSSSGVNWSVVDTPTPFELSNKRAQASGASTFSRVCFLLPEGLYDALNRPSFIAKWDAKTFTADTQIAGVSISIDKDNQYYFAGRGRDIVWGKVISGVATEVERVAITVNQITANGGSIGFNLRIRIDPRIGVKRLEFDFFRNDAPSQSLSFSESSNDFVSLLPENPKSTLNFGLIKLGSGDSSSVNNLTIEKLV